MPIRLVCSLRPDGWTPLATASPIHTNESIATKSIGIYMPDFYCIWRFHQMRERRRARMCVYVIYARFNLIEIHVIQIEPRRVIWLGATQSQKNWRRIFRAFSFWLNWLHCGSPEAAPNVIFFGSALSLYRFPCVCFECLVSFNFTAASENSFSLSKCFETCISNHNKVHWKLQLKHSYTNSRPFYQIHTNNLNGESDKRRQYQGDTNKGDNQMMNRKISFYWFYCVCCCRLLAVHPSVNFWISN